MDRFIIIVQVLSYFVGFLLMYTERMLNGYLFFIPGISNGTCMMFCLLRETIVLQ